MKFTVDTPTIQRNGTLEDFYYNLFVGRDDLTKNSIDDVTTVEGTLELSISEVNSILSNGGSNGEVYNYLMALRADKDILTDNVPEGLPKRNTFTNLIHTIETWFDTTCELWANAAEIENATQVYILTNPQGTTQEQYLKGSEIKILYDSFGGATPSQVDRNLTPRTISQFNEDVSSGWFRIN